MVVCMVPIMGMAVFMFAIIRMVMIIYMRMSALVVMIVCVGYRL